MNRKDSESWWVVGLIFTTIGTILVLASIENPEILNTGIIVLIIWIIVTLVGLIF